MIVDFSTLNGKENFFLYLWGNLNNHQKKKIADFNLLNPEREGTMGCLKFSNNVFLFVGLTILGTWVSFDRIIGWLIKLSVQTLQLLISIYRSDNFVYHHYGCTLIYGHCLIPLDTCLAPPVLSIAQTSSNVGKAGKLLKDF